MFLTESEYFWSARISLYLVITIFLLYFIKRRLNKTKNIPPGPISLPFFGYFPFLGKHPAVDLAKLSKKYGPVFSLYLGNRFCVILNDIKSLKEAFNKESFNARPPNSSFRLSTDTAAFIEYSGPEWSEQRRFSLKVLRNFGFGKTRMEDVIKNEIDYLLREYEKSKKTPTTLKTMMQPSSTNLICVLLFGKRFNFDDPERQALDNYLEEISFVHAPISHHACFPWFRKLFFGLGLKFGDVNYNTASKVLDEIVTYNWKEIDRHEKTSSDEHRDYIDSYLAEMKSHSKGTNIFTKENLNGNIQMFIRAGTMSSRSTIEWCLMACARYPSMQRKIQTEIVNAIGTERTPCWSDHDMMPYTHAFILEVQRWKTIVPVNLLRYTECDTTVQGYDIPAGSLIVGNFWAVHNDTNVWEQPERMMPERFLNEDGTKVVNSDAFVSFSVGRRACPGSSLAIVMIFLYLTTILQKYNVVPPPGENLNFDGIAYMSYHPIHFRLLLEPR